MRGVGWPASVERCFFARVEIKIRVATTGLDHVTRKLSQSVAVGYFHCVPEGRTDVANQQPGRAQREVFFREAAVAGLRFTTADDFLAVF